MQSMKMENKLYANVQAKMDDMQEETKVLTSVNRVGSVFSRKRRKYNISSH